MRELKTAWRNCRPHCPSVDPLFHYTSAEGLHGILTTRKIRLSNVSTLNDASEMLYGRDVISKVLLSRLKGQDSALNLAAVYQKGTKFVEEGLVSQSYVFCFCSKDDLLSQWRAYGEGGAGFAIGFNRVRLEEYLQKGSLRVSDPMPLVYSEDCQERVVSCFVSKAEDIAACKYNLTGRGLCEFEKEFAFWLFQYPLFMKHPSFSEEKEWRILQVSRDPKDVMFRPGRGIVIPYLELSDIPADVFASVTFGPGHDPKFGVKPMEFFLKQKQLQHVKVQASEIPLRTLRY
jgi:hypothetical protein